MVDDEGFWHAMQILAGDKIVDVRLRVARLLGALSGTFYGCDKIR